MFIPTIIGEGADPSLPLHGIDPLTDDLPDGAVTFLFDFFADYEASHAAAAYLNGQVIADLAAGDDGAMAVAAGNVVGSVADLGGADFSAITTGTGGTNVRGSVGCLADIRTGAQHFLLVGYFTLPSLADWNTAAALAAFFQTADADYTAGADLATVAQYTTGGVPRLEVRRQTNGGSGIVQTVLFPDAAAYGKLAQLAFWRNAAGVGLRLRTSASDQAVTGAVGAANSGDFSATRPQWGLTNGFWTMAGVPAHVNAANFAVHRGWIENLEVSGRPPATVLDEDWARISARVAALTA